MGEVKWISALSEPPRLSEAPLVAQELALVAAKRALFCLSALFSIHRARLD